VRDFVVSNTNVPAGEAVALMSSDSRATASGAELTDWELEILRLLGKGGTTSSVADQLHISRTTVNNHVQPGPVDQRQGRMAQDLSGHLDWANLLANSRLRSLPVGPLGISATKRTVFGHL
jgi:FixJ family two-component response regulator